MPKCNCKWNEESGTRLSTVGLHICILTTAKIGKETVQSLTCTKMGTCHRNIEEMEHCLTVKSCCILFLW